jgi:hypothetical protein
VAEKDVLHELVKIVKKKVSYSPWVSALFWTITFYMFGLIARDFAGKYFEDFIFSS